MSKKYIVIADRRTIALYFAWEFGVSNATRYIKEQIQGEHIINPICPRPCKTKRKAESLARRVRESAAFMQGKFGKVTYGSHVEVRLA